MEPIKVTLCEHCGACPSVEITGAGVTIGEQGNLVRLSHEEWNDLVKKIQAGEFRTVNCC
jgi:hypothetical protein